MVVILIAAWPMHFTVVFIYTDLPSGAHRYDTETHMGLLTLSKNIRQLALFLSLYHIRIGRNLVQTRQL